MAYESHQFRLYPTACQGRGLTSQLGTLCHVYNAALEYWRDYYAEYKLNPKPDDLYKVFASIRNLQIADQKSGGAGPHWLTRVSSCTIRDTILRVKRAFWNFFRRVREKKGAPGYPRFKKANQFKSIPIASYGKLQGGCKFQDRNGANLFRDLPACRSGCRFYLFGVGKIKVLIHRAVPGVIKTISVKRDVDGKWYICLAAQTPDVTPIPSALPPVGIDVGLEHFLTTSDGEHVENPRILKNHLKELRRRDRAVARKVSRAKYEFRDCRKGKNFRKAAIRVGSLHVRVRNLRKEFHNRVAGDLIRRYGTICVENLGLQGLMRGKLSGSIGDAAWGGFITILQHKAEKAGVKVVEVNARNTSQECPQCGGEVKKSLKQRVHDCHHCGLKIHRDVASARVILARGVAGASGSVAVQRNLGSSRDAGRSLLDANRSHPAADPLNEAGAS